MNMISNCPLCKEHGLHILEVEEIKTMQCLNCGYASSTKYEGTIEENESYKELTDEMKEWSKEANGNIWIPSFITLPFAMIYPFNNEKGELKWGYSEMVDIPEEEQKDYPREDGDGFHTKKYDTDNKHIFDEFLFALSKANELAKKEGLMKEVNSPSIQTFSNIDINSDIDG